MGKCVAPIRILSMANGCSAVSRRTRIGDFLVVDAAR
jgi:hypothetical protein